MDRTLLVVDDEVNVRKLLRAVLEDEGYAVTEASDGRKALEHLQQHRPAGILLDVMMPNMDGIALAQELGRQGLRPQIPIIMLSAATAVKEAATKVQADGFVSKPFDLDTLLDVVNRCVDRKLVAQVEVVLPNRFPDTR